MSRIKTKVLNEQERNEVIAENMRERVYSTITMLAVLIVLWQSADHHSTLGAIGTIVGAVVGLWAASLIAARISYRAIHGIPINSRQYLKAFFTSAGLLTPAGGPVLILAFGGITGLYSLETGLVASMVTSLLFLFALSFIASRKIYTSIWRQLLVSLLEMSVGLGIIVLKLLVGK